MPFLPEADSEVKKLVARFFPYKNLPGYLLINIKTLLGKKNLKGSMFFEGEKFIIETTEAFPAQADGDFLSNTPLTVETTTNTIQVLTSK